MTKTKVFFLLLTVVLSLVMTEVSAATTGSVTYVRGAVTKQSVSDGSNAHLLVKGNELSVGDVIKTGSKSFTMLKLEDGTRLTIRPNTSFVVEEMNARKDSSASAVLRLFRGGLRAITGFISKKNPNGYHLRTSIATIGIRGTIFDARLCGDECSDEDAKLRKKKETPKIVAKIIFMRGKLQALSFDEKLREIKSNSALFEGDTIITSTRSFAVLAFKDKSRVTLQANTRFRIDEMRYDEANKKESSSLFSLLKGGLRSVTGLIGKLNPSRVRMHTSIATIGIRGTGYDLSCSGACAFDNSVPQNMDLPDGPGLYSSVWDGEITMGGQKVGLNQSAHKSSQQSPVTLLAKIPAFFKNNPAPKPGSIKVKEENLFQKSGTEEVPPGLYVSVEEGKVEVTPVGGAKSKKIGAQQAVHVSVDGAKIRQLPAIPVFQEYDNYPKPGKAANVKVLLGGGIGQKNKKEKVCQIK